MFNQVRSADGSWVVVDTTNKGNDSPNKRADSSHNESIHSFGQMTSMRDQRTTVSINHGFNRFIHKYKDSEIFVSKDSRF